MRLTSPSVTDVVQTFILVFGLHDNPLTHQESSWSINKSCMITMKKQRLQFIEIPLKRVSVDIVGLIEPRSEKRNRYILAMIAYATRNPKTDALQLKS